MIKTHLRRCFNEMAKLVSSSAKIGNEQWKEVCREGKHMERGKRKEEGNVESTSPESEGSGRRRRRAMVEGGSRSRGSGGGFILEEEPTSIRHLKYG